MIQVMPADTVERPAPPREVDLRDAPVDAYVSDERDEVADRILAFFRRADGLTPQQVIALVSAARGKSLGHLNLETEPAFLTAVSGGAWTHHHSVMARRIHVASRECAHRLTSWPRRRAVALVLENAALVVLATQSEAVLPADLLRRMSGAWCAVLGSSPETLDRVA